MAPADALLPCKIGHAASLLDGLRGGDAPPGGEGGRRLIDGCREMGEEAAVACHGCRVGVLGAKLF